MIFEPLIAFLNINAYLCINPKFSNMRFTKFLAILVLGIVSNSFVCHAQYENYYEVEGSKFIVTSPDAELYLLPESYNKAVTSGEAFNYGYRDIVDVSNVKSKTIRKPLQLRAVRYTNVTKSRNFDAYIVEYKDKLWVLKSNDVQDNSLLNSQNDRVSKDKKNLELQHDNSVAKKQNLTQKRGELNRQLDSLSAYYVQICTDSICYYKNLEVRLPEIRDSLVSVAERAEQARVDKEFDDWCKAQPASTKAAAKAISIDYAALDYPNSVGGCDYNFEFTNNSSKTIKYLYWTGTAYNAVNDPVYCEIRRKATFSGKDTGPIEQGESGGGCWDCIIYNYSADYIRLLKIEIIYMDGSSINIGAADIARLMGAPSREVSVDSWEVAKDMISSRECQNNITLWGKRLVSVQSQKSYDGEWAELKSSPYNQIISSLSDVEAQERQVQKEITYNKSDIDLFNKFVGFEKFATTNQKTTTYSQSGSYSSGTSGASSSKKSPFITFGIEGSLEGLKSVSGGLGLSMRIGRYSSLFNATIGAKYQYTAYKKSVSYSYTDNMSYHYSYADYKHNVSQVVFPVVLNWNILRDDMFSLYLGVGYEYGVLISDKQLFDYNFGDDFNVSDFYQHGSDELVLLSTPSRSPIIQVGFAGRRLDWKVYYKIHRESTMLANSEKGAIGTALTYYF